MVTSELVCAVCNAPWHPATGVLVGHPHQSRMCGRCWRESLATLKWATGRRPRKGQPDFYEHAAPADADAANDDTMAANQRSHETPKP